MKSGQYIFQAWGAQGGPNRKGLQGGRGGYVYGQIFLQKKLKISIEIGASGLVESPFFTYGNGGRGSLHNPNEPSEYCGASGGGATSVYASNNDRILVAGGGAGSAFYYDHIKGGSAGGLVAESGREVHKLEHVPLVGCGGNFNEPIQKNCNNDFDDGRNYWVSGGGGGYIPGGRGTTVNTGVSSGGGGSSFLSGYGPCQVVNHIKFVNGEIKGGNEQFVSPYSSVNETGHIGNGVFLLTVISVFDPPTENISQFFSYFAPLVIHPSISFD